MVFQGRKVCFTWVNLFLYVTNYLCQSHYVSMVLQLSNILIRCVSVICLNVNEFIMFVIHSVHEQSLFAMYINNFQRTSC